MTQFAQTFLFDAHQQTPSTAPADQLSASQEKLFEGVGSHLVSNSFDFDGLNLSRPLLKACGELGYRKATPIQAAAIPLVLAGRDICGSAVTGSGKTAAFALPLLERLLYRPRGISTTYILILTPTRELALQIHGVMKELGKFTDIQVALIVGGFSLQVQSAMLDARPEILVATPGRLIDHLRNSRSFDLETVRALVLDEADKLLKMGFINEVQEIVKSLPKDRQTMLFSATMTEEVKKLMQLSLKRPVRLAADPTGRIPNKLTQEIVRLKGEEMRSKKEAILCALCCRTFAKGRVIIFCSTKKRVHRLKLLFNLLKLPSSGELHSDMSQTDRMESLEKFRNSEYCYLLATDVAGRGLDIVAVEVVINYDAPPSLDTYLHRIGRTARAGAEGQAVTFITDTNRELLKEVVEATKQKITHRIIPSEAIDYYYQQIQLHERHLMVVERNEKEEKKLEEVEKEAERVKNVIEHEKEIQARPPRTWFQTSKQKTEAKRLAKMEDDGLLNTDDLFLSGKKQRPNNQPLSKSKEVKKGEKGAEENPDMVEMKTVKGKVRAIKRRIQQYQTQGVDSRLALQKAQDSIGSQEMDVDSVLNDFPSKAKNKQKKKNKESRAEGERDSNPKVYPGGRKTHQPKFSTVNKRRINKIKRAGKGKHSFKGRTKYKRR